MVFLYFRTDIQSTALYFLKDGYRVKLSMGHVLSHKITFSLVSPQANLIYFVKLKL